MRPPPKAPAVHKGYVRGGPGIENDLVGCGHCSAALDVKPGLVGVSSSVPMCRPCMRFVCDSCNQKLQTDGCVTWETMLERMERAGQQRRRFLESVTGSSK